MSHRAHPILRRGGNARVGTTYPQKSSLQTLLICGGHRNSHICTASLTYIGASGAEAITVEHPAVHWSMKLAAYEQSCRCAGVHRQCEVLTCPSPRLLQHLPSNTTPPCLQMDLSWGVARTVKDKGTRHRESKHVQALGGRFIAFFEVIKVESQPVAGADAQDLGMDWSWFPASLWREVSADWRIVPLVVQAFSDILRHSQTPSLRFVGPLGPARHSFAWPHAGLVRIHANPAQNMRTRKMAVHGQWLACVALNF